MRMGIENVSIQNQSDRFVYFIYVYEIPNGIDRMMNRKKNCLLKRCVFAEAHSKCSIVIKRSGKKCKNLLDISTASHTYGIFV